MLPHPNKLCKEELGAEVTGIIKAIFSCKAGKEAMESLSLRSVVFFSLCMPRIMLTARNRLHRGLCSLSQILPPRGSVPSILCKGTRHI